MRYILQALFCCVLVSSLVGSAYSTEPPFACDGSNPSTQSYKFCKTSLPINERVQDLISRLTIDEKIAQLVDTTPPIPRLGIPGFEWWSEALHGVTGWGRGILTNGTIKAATTFPQVILSAAAFNPSLWYRIAKAIGIEARAFYNQGQANGLAFWAPNVNIFRDPRWGRGQETPGEDPSMVGKYSVSYVRGLQGDSFQGGNSPSSENLTASACCKHFTAYDLDDWKGTTRYTFNAQVTAQDMADTYQPPFRSCVEEGRASGMMCSYNQVNGVPTCADFNLLSKTAREGWGFNGYIASDCDAVSIIFAAQGYAKTPEDAVADVLKAGMDLNCGSYLLKHSKSALEQKKISESDIDRALQNLFSVRMRLGLFNGNPKQLPNGNIGPNQVCSKEHQDLALEAARDGIVLLKNSAQLLPLSKTKVRTLAVIGPNADAPQTLIGNYAGPPCKYVSPLQALKSYVNDIKYYSGCDTVACSSGSIDKAVQLAAAADNVILVMGLDLTQEKEKLDRVDLTLPGMQQNLITSVAKAAKAPVVLVLLCGGPVDISFAKDDPKIGSILWAGYPGESGGIALAEIIFGDHNPGGRLPVTWYPQDFTKVPMTDMRMRPDPASGYPGRTYRFYTGRKVFEFGFGLSYTKYTHEFVSVTKSQIHVNQSSNLQAIEKSGTPVYKTEEMSTEFCDGLRFSAIVGVKNHGELSGRHPVLLFLLRSEVRGGSPLKQLVGFQSVHLGALEKAEIEFPVSPCEHFSKTDEDGSSVMESGSHFLVVGDDKYQVSVVI